MKIARIAKATKDGWAFDVSGPGMGVAKAPSLWAALSIAQNKACFSDLPGTWLVKEYEDVIYRVERTDEPFLVLTVPVNGGGS